MENKQKTIFHTWDTALAAFHPKASESYRQGFRDGWLDKYMGHRSTIALTWPTGGYATGYYDGHRENTQC